MKLCVLLVTWFCRTLLWSSPVAAQGNCIFPFIYNGVSHNKCITENDPEGKPWCSTKTDEQNNHVLGGGFWKHCTVPNKGCSNTPDNSLGNCIPIAQCPLLKTIFQQVRNGGDGIETLRGSICENGGSGLKVCCPQIKTSTNSPIIKPTISSPTSRRTPLPRSCGVNARNDRITGGEDAGLGSHPWNVIFRGRERIDGGGSCIDSNPSCRAWADIGECQKNPDFMKENCKKSCNNCPSGSTGVTTWFCGGVLITEQHVLTAAHCFPNSIDIEFVRIGEYDLSKEIDTEETLTAPKTQDIKVARIIKHEKWDYDCRRCNDIAIAKLEHPARFHQFYVQPICLPTEPLEESIGFSVAAYQNKHGIATGWGVTDTANAFQTTKGSDILQKVQLLINELNFCHQRKDIYPDKNMILCAGKGDGKDTCRGDSGGPLMLTDKFGQIWYAVGIASFGDTVCGSKNGQSIFTNVHHYIDWIKSNLV